MSVSEAMLIDDLRVKDVGVASPAGMADGPKALEALDVFQRMMQRFQDNFRFMKVFNIQNVADYYYQETCQRWDLQKDFVCLAPPFEYFWMEYRHPRLVLEHEDEVNLKGPLILRPATLIAGTRIGVLFQGGDRDDPRTHDTTCKFIEEMYHHEGIPADVKDLPWRYLLHCSVWFEVPGSGFAVAFATNDVLLLDDRGRCLMGLKGVMKHQDTKNERFKAERAIAQKMEIPGLIALNLLHCKNVVQHEQTPPGGANKRFSRKFGEPLSVYKVLEVNALRKVIRRPKAEGNEPLEPRRLHVCRGHFKDFREGKGLGKGHAHGVWWWSDQVRGAKEAGQVFKRYEVQGAVRKRLLEGGDPLDATLRKHFQQQVAKVKVPADLTDRVMEKIKEEGGK